jgi:hypothetical protein
VTGKLRLLYKILYCFQNTRPLFFLRTLIIHITHLLWPLFPHTSLAQQSALHKRINLQGDKMFNSTKAPKRLENVDYDALVRLARQERARYLADLFKTGKPRVSAVTS